VHLLTRGHFRSRDKDGGNTIQTTIPEKPMLHANLLSLCFITGVMADRSFTLQKCGFSTLFAPVTFTLTDDLYI